MSGTTSGRNVPGTATLFLCDPQEITFPLYRSILCHQFPFFNPAFNGLFIEGQSQSMTLEDISAEKFGLFVHWMHYQVIASQNGVECGHTCLIPVETLIKLWVLGERFLVLQLQNKYWIYCKLDQGHTE
ncbi:hypothetical protein BDZ45DRAFT_749134 [Acephala macrosclerotiorum]|nr:hypothetical protein BDZ45DRAFT_749134 [Acephala macrosclerotiorum]